MNYDYILPAIQPCKWQKDQDLMFVFQSDSTETRSKLNNIKADNIRQDVRVFSGYLVIFSGPPLTASIYNHFDLTPGKNCQLRSTVLSYYPVACKQARSFCKSKTGQFFKPIQFFFENRIQVLHEIWSSFL